jgi:hypothetical protein
LEATPDFSVIFFGKLFALIDYDEFIKHIQKSGRPILPHGDHCGERTTLPPMLNRNNNAGGYNALSKLDRSGRGGDAGVVDGQRSSI